MKIHTTDLSDCFIIEPTVFEDQRGFFYESFNERKFNDLIGREIHFVQDNQSFSEYGVIRGLHAQTGDFAQAKLVRVLEGEVLDVIVDARPDSATFGKHIAVKLSAENTLQLFIPRGFLHGFSVLSPTAVFFYKCDNYYHKDSETGVFYKDSQLNIDWLVPDEKRIVSEKDLILPEFRQVFNQ